MSPPLWATGLALLALVLFSLTTMATRFAANRVDSELGFTVAVGVNAILSAAVLLVALPLREQPPDFDASAAALFAVAGLFSTFLGRWFLFEAVLRLGAARASVFPTATPLVTALFAWVLLGDRPTWGAGFAMVAAVCGLVLVSDPPRSMPAPQPGTPRARPVFVVGLLSVCAYATGNVLRADAVRSWNEPLIGAFLGAIAACLLQLAATSRKRPGVIERLRAADRIGVYWYMVVGVCGIVAHFCVIAAMRHLPAAEVALITTGTPLLVFPLSYWLLRQSEAIVARTLFGLGLTLVGVGYLVSRPLWAGH